MLSSLYSYSHINNTWLCTVQGSLACLFPLWCIYTHTYCVWLCAGNRLWPSPHAHSLWIGGPYHGPAMWDSVLHGAWSHIQQTWVYQDVWCVEPRGHYVHSVSSPHRNQLYYSLTPLIRSSLPSLSPSLPPSLPSSLPPFIPCSLSPPSLQSPFHSSRLSLLPPSLHLHPLIFP